MGSRHPQIVQRFRNEARAAAATRSPNIVATRDFGQLEDGSWYLVMDYWEGATLGAFLAARGPLSHSLIVRIAIDVLSGLAAAHKHNIIHRDLKPDNLYLADVDGDFRVMILDFGVCRLGEEVGVATRSGAVIGTPRYMAPEQFRGHPIDHRADLWAIGAVLYEAATGGLLPYDDEGAPRGQILDDAVLHARMSYPPIDPQRRWPGIARPLADAILRLLDPEPARRPETATGAALLLAATWSGDGHEPGGLETMQQRAPHLLKGAQVRDTLRPATVVALQRLAVPVAAPASPSTLGSVASQQSAQPGAPPPRRRWLFASLATAIVATTVFAIVRVAGRSPDAVDSAMPIAGSSAGTNPAGGDPRAPIAPPRQPAVAPRPAPALAPPHAKPFEAPPNAGARPDAGVAVTTRGVAHLDAGIPGAGETTPSDAGTTSVARTVMPVDAGGTTPSGSDAGVALVRPDAGVTSPPAARSPAEIGAAASRSTARSPMETGQLSIYAVPFAQVWVDEEVDSAGQTPLHLKLRVGSHRIRLVNKRLNKNKTVRVTITTSQKAVIDETTW